MITEEQEYVAVQQEALPMALCWLRLVRGFPSLRAADRHYRARVRPEAAESEFASRLSRIERGVIECRTGTLIEILATFGVSFRDVETSIDVMSLAARGGTSGVRRALKANRVLRERVRALVVESPDQESPGRAAFSDLVISAVEEALAR